MAIDTGIGDFRSGFLRFCPFGSNPTPEDCKTVIVAQMLATGTATPGQIVEVYSLEQAATLFGYGSIAYDALKYAFMIDRRKSVFVIPVSDAAGAVAAVWDMNVTGPATESGSINIEIFGTLYTVPVVAGDADTTIAANIASVIGADQELPFTVSVSGNTVSFTAKNGGTVGNFFQYVLNPYVGQKTPAGVGISTVQATVGAGDPVLTTSDIEGATGGCCYDCFALTWQDEGSIQAFISYLNDETGTWSCQSTLCFGHLFHAKSENDAAAIATYADAYNDQERTIIPHKIGYKYAPWQLVVSWSRRTCIAACFDPSRPVVRDNGALTGMMDHGNCGSIWTVAEKEALLDAGVAVWDVSNQRTNVGSTLWIENNITNWKYNAFGQPDRTWQQVATRFQVRQLISDLRAHIETRFPSVALVSNGVPIPPGRKAVSPNHVEMAIRGFLRQYRGILIDDATDLSGVVRVERDTEGKPCGYGDPNRLNVLLDVDFTNQLLRMAFGVNVIIEGKCPTA